MAAQNNVKPMGKFHLNWRFNSILLTKGRKIQDPGPSVDFSPWPMN